VLIPIRDENPTSRTAWVTLAIIAINVVVFLAWQPTLNAGPNGIRQQLFFFCHAEIPWEVTHQTSLAQGGAAARAAIDQEIPGQGAALQHILHNQCPDKSWWQSIFVAMFLHESWLHIGGNMLFLWVFGNNVEDKIGWLWYIVFYFVSGIVASAAQILTGVNSVIPSLGASGAIAGVLGAYLVMFPRRRVLSLVPIIFVFSLISLPAVVVLGFWFVLQFFSGATSLAQHVNGGVAYFAHIGGFVTGVIAALLFFPKERRPRAAPGPPAW
jgi:membrane associated rhomboid family serine protease